MSSVASIASDHCWSSAGLSGRRAFSQWRDWACDAIAPMDIKVPDESDFVGSQRTIGLGRLALVTVRATEQHIIHRGSKTSDPVFQLMHSRSKRFETRVGGKDFCVEPGQFVLLNNAQSYEMRTQSAHVASVLTMPQSWLERWIPEPWTAVARPFSATSKWGAPLGSLLIAMADDIDASSLPRGVLTDQVGALLALAVGDRPPSGGSHRARLRKRILEIIEEKYTDPLLEAGSIAREVGISKRYLQALLADSGATFVGCVNSVRLDRARQLLADSRRTGHRTSEIAWQCGFRDPDYFARVFRKRFGSTPTEWRKLLTA
jgi:AraC-like DNA-binding protein